MGQKHSRRRLDSRGAPGGFQHAHREGASSAASGELPLEVAKPEKPKYPFRCEDRSSIPDDLVEGPFETFEIAGDVYSTAYLIARNSGDMYSINPLKNPDVRIVWAFLLFICLSQLYVILSVTLWFPPSVKTASIHIDCSNSTSLAGAHSRGFISAANAETCREVGTYAFDADVRGVTVSYHTLEKSTLYYDAILTGGEFTIYLLRLICCIWVFSQIYLQQFASIRSLLAYHDFSCWFLPLKGETLGHGWTIVLPLIQYVVLLVVATVSFVILCAQDEAFDVVMNTLAFTFIAEVGSYFNDPLSKRMARKSIKGLDTKDYPFPIFYLYPEYLEANSLNDDGTYTDGGWYILEEEEKAGLLSDYKVKHNPAKYTQRYTNSLGFALELALFAVPAFVVALGAIRCNFFLPATPTTAAHSEL
mmetsp:Transcript_158640/g.280188  ORF Transcript_158640/g.280188 Transcript_158640/m.280188 type:complete len:419 (-) Transcript_158640:157-1413(-)